MSYDKTVLGVGFIEGNEHPLCNSNAFNNLPNHKFVLWEKQ